MASTLSAGMVVNRQSHKIIKHVTSGDAFGLPVIGSAFQPCDQLGLTSLLVKG
ncbi:hypothetical protein D3C72_2380730 [compost metagenome]